MGHLWNNGHIFLMVRPKVVDVGLLRKILNDPVMLCHERGAVRAPIAIRVGGGCRDGKFNLNVFIDDNELRFKM